MTTVNLDEIEVVNTSKRRCGECSLCCRLIPVPEVDKTAGQRCRYQRHTGCKIYARRPNACRLWFCRWIITDDTDDMRRPDRSHYVIDTSPDYITITYEDGTPSVKVRVEQIWVDPNYPDAHRDPALRAYLERRGHDGIAGLVRWNQTDGMVIWPASMSGEAEAREQRTALNPEAEHKPADVIGMIARGEI